MSDTKPDPEALGTNRSSTSRRTLIWVAFAVVILFMLYRTGIFAEREEQAPVRYLLSDPEVITEDGRTVAEYWVHVPVRTEIETTELLLADFIVPALEEQKAEDPGAPDADLRRFYVFDTPKPGEDRIKEAKIDEPDHVYEHSEDTGLTAVNG